MGFRENPFSKYSAEEEKAYLSKIYEKPKKLRNVRVHYKRRCIFRNGTLSLISLDDLTRYRVCEIHEIPTL